MGTHKGTALGVGAFREALMEVGDPPCINEDSEKPKPMRCEFHEYCATEKAACLAFARYVAYKSYHKRYKADGTPYTVVTGTFHKDTARYPTTLRYQNIMINPRLEK